VEVFALGEVVGHVDAKPEVKGMIDLLGHYELGLPISLLLLKNPEEAMSLVTGDVLDINGIGKIRVRKVSRNPTSKGTVIIHVLCEPFDWRAIKEQYRRV
jgi:hypothetical protein